MRYSPLESRAIRLSVSEFTIVHREAAKDCLPPEQALGLLLLHQADIAQKEPSRLHDIRRQSVVAFAIFTVTLPTLQWDKIIAAAHGTDLALDPSMGRNDICEQFSALALSQFDPVFLLDAGPQPTNREQSDEEEWAAIVENLRHGSIS